MKESGKTGLLYQFRNSRIVAQCHDMVTELLRANPRFQKILAGPEPKTIY